jgi:hypothetical protein
MTTIRADQAEAMGGSAPCRPAQPPTLTPVSAPAREAGPPVIIVDREKPSWLAFDLVDDDGKPMAGEPFTVTLPNGQQVHGKLDAKGAVRIEGIDPGTCKVSFEERDKDGWKRK